VSKRRVVVTGLGHISPVGNDVVTGWANLLAGKSGIGKVTRFDASDLNCQIAGEVKDFDISAYISPRKHVVPTCSSTTALQQRCRPWLMLAWTMLLIWTRPALASTSVPVSAVCR
jgi:3-oxoacyl-(acyl-carrier-protein) synthase